MKKAQIENLPERITLKTLASLSGYTERRLRQLVDESRLPAVVDGMIPIGAIRELFLFLSRDTEELRKEKLLKTRAEREIRQVEAEAAAGRFQSVEIFNRNTIVMGEVINKAITAAEKPLTAALEKAAPGADPMAIRVAMENAVNELRATIKQAIEDSEVTDQKEEA